MTLLGTLLVINVHLRDVCEELNLKNLQSIDSFEWYKQIKYYFIPDQEIEIDAL
jgi:hypothetical protein